MEFARRHADDDWFDTILSRSRGDAPILQCVTRIRYKTSGMSGDEWRTGTMWQRFVDGSWEDFDGGYSDLDAACKAIYPGVYKSHPDMADIPSKDFLFIRKGRVLYRAHYDEKEISLLSALGHLPWAMTVARENSERPSNDEEFCFQPGCSAKAVSKYRLKQTYSAQGEGPLPDRHIEYYRAFCKRHLKRGDCGREDADENYIVISGPGPAEQDWSKARISESSFGGFVDL